MLSTYIHIGAQISGDTTLHFLYKYIQPEDSCAHYWELCHYCSCMSPLRLFCSSDTSSSPSH